MTWLPWPVLTRKQWPALHYGEKRGITWEEHQAVVAAEINPERKAFFELAWHVGAAQIDLVSLKTEDVDWQNRLISYKRRKTGTPAILRFDEEVASILKRLPQTGSLFPNLSKFTSSNRAAHFWHLCQRLLRVAFGVTHGLGALSPGITIGMQADARKPEALAQMPEEQGGASGLREEGPCGIAILGEL